MKSARLETSETPSSANGHGRFVVFDVGFSVTTRPWGLARVVNQASPALDDVVALLGLREHKRAVFWRLLPDSRPSKDRQRCDLGPMGMGDDSLFWLFPESSRCDCFDLFLT